jgi:antitoxin component YwqK of YwqJK toxin-antitoxin module
METGKRSYEQYKMLWDNIEICTPCYLKSYDVKNILVSEGEQYQDCTVGIWKEYYPNGRLKIRGQYKRNNTEDWKALYKRNLCEQKDGEWIYYHVNGGIIKREMYKDNVLVE